MPVRKRSQKPDVLLRVLDQWLTISGTIEEAWTFGGTNTLLVLASTFCGTHASSASTPPFYTKQNGYESAHTHVLVTHTLARARARAHTHKHSTRSHAHTQRHALTFLHTHTPAYTLTGTHTHILTHAHTSIHSNRYSQTHTHTYTRMHAPLLPHTHAYTFKHANHTQTQSANNHINAFYLACAQGAYKHVK